MSIVGTSSEQEPGVGGAADHPAPALMIGEDGFMRQHGEASWTAGDQTPTDDQTDKPAGDGLSDEARAALHAHSEPVQLHTDRPDIGTAEQATQEESE